MDTAEPSPEPSTDGVSVARILYASQSLLQVAVYQEMERIRASAVAHNAPDGVFTALLHRSGWFLQWKEGPGAAVQRTMEQVARDPRHHSLQIVHSSWGPRNLAGIWSMAIIQSMEQPGEMSARVAEVRRDTGRGTQHAPAAVWQRLAMPIWRGAAAPPAALQSFQSILVCSALGPQPFELVTWLSDLYGGEIVRGRLAGLDFEGGIDYADCPRRDKVLRVVALARGGLAVPLMGALLGDFSHVVLLFDAAEDLNRKLMGLVDAACAGTQHPPALIGVGGTADTHSEMLTVAQRRGMTCVHAAPPSSQDSADYWRVIEPQLAPLRRPADAPASYQVEVLLQGPLRGLAPRD